MTAQEANKIIAEFLGWRLENNNWILGDFEKDGHETGCPNTDEYKDYAPNNYIRSLDALVPVWEKLKDFHNGEIDISLAPDEKHWVSIDHFKDGHCYSSSSRGETVQEAAAIATAKAIKEMVKE